MFVRIVKMSFDAKCIEAFKQMFEKKKSSSEIKGDNGHFFFLSDLIPKLISSKKWTLGRNSKESLPKIKKLGDLSAHNRRFNAKKSDINAIKDELRIVIEELVLLIDY